VGFEGFGLGDLSSPASASRALDAGTATADGTATAGINARTGIIH
jgi:hypothetical protein